MSSLRRSARAGTIALPRSDRHAAGGARPGASGFGLVELLAAMLLGGLVLGAAIALLHTHGAIARRGQVTIAVSGAAAWAGSIAARDVQLAGADPMRAGIAALVAAGPESVVLQSDRDGDGAIDPSSAERVALRWSAASGGLFVRALGGQSMALAGGVRRGDLRFRYFAADGAEIGSSATGAALGAEALAAVRRVVIELAVAERVAGREEWARVTAGAALRACAGDDT